MSTRAQDTPTLPAARPWAPLDPSALPTPGRDLGREAADFLKRNLAWLLRGSLLLLFLVPGTLGQYPMVILTLTLVYAVVLSSQVVLTGYVGQISLCQASFMGLGAFLCGALMGNYGWSYWVAAPLAIAAVFVAGVLVGLPALRLRGLTLAIVTLSLALLADNFLFTDVNWLTNNGNHWSISTPPILFGVALDNASLPDTEALYRVVLAVLLITLLAVVRLRQGRTGKSWFAMRDAEIAAATSGVRIVSAKLLGFGIAAALAALGGVLHFLTLGNASPDPYNFAISIQLLALAVIAGVRWLPGALFAAFFFAVLPQVLLSQKELSSLTSLILGAGLIVQIIFAPQGLGGTFEHLRRRLFARVDRSRDADTFGAAVDAARSAAGSGARSAKGRNEGGDDVTV